MGECNDNWQQILGIQKRSQTGGLHLHEQTDRDTGRDCQVSEYGKIIFEFIFSLFFSQIDIAS